MRHPHYVEPLEFVCRAEMEFPPGIGFMFAITDWYQPWKPVLMIRIGFWELQIGWIPRPF